MEFTNFKNLTIFRTEVYFIQILHFICTFYINICYITIEIILKQLVRLQHSEYRLVITLSSDIFFAASVAVTFSFTREKRLYVFLHILIIYLKQYNRTMKAEE